MRAFKIFVSLLFILLPASVSRAQFARAGIGINGLTCSQCSRSVEMQLRKLSFVKDVQMDLEHTEGTIHFSQGSKVDIEALARAVKDAGFSLRYLKASISRDHISSAGDQCFLIGSDTYIADHKIPDSGMLTFTFTGKKFGSAKRTAPFPTSSCHGSGKVYYVLLL